MQELGWRFKQKGSWLVVDTCPFCTGGDHRDTQTFIVHAEDGNYSCSRSKCGERGTFWGLLLAVGKKVQDYLGERVPAKKKRQKKKGYVYGR